MEFWKQIYPDKIHTVRYEDLVTTPITTLQVVAQFCSLDVTVDPDVMHIHAREVDSWKHYEAQLVELVGKEKIREFTSQA